MFPSEVRNLLEFVGREADKESINDESRQKKISKKKETGGEM